MLSFEVEPDHTVTTTEVADVLGEVADVETVSTGSIEEAEPAEPAEPPVLEESVSSPAARMLELAAGTADQLIADAQTEAESLVAAARATADEVLDGLATDKAALEAQIATLQKLQSRHSTQMRDLLTHQLSLLEAVPEQTAVAG
jgi:cell division septum initiation protein DivIVA